MDPAWYESTADPRLETDSPLGSRDFRNRKHAARCHQLRSLGERERIGTRDTRPP